MGTADTLLGEGAKRRARRALVVAAATLTSVVVIQPAIPAIAQAVAPARATVSGVVFTDRDGDGVRGEGETGIPKVSVSDGVSIVETDETGAYTLQTDPDRRLTDIVFVTQPAGFSVGVDEFKTPRFYRQLAPLVDGGQATADFGLIPDPKSQGNDFTFANVADPHVNANLGSQLQEINSTGDNLAFVQVSGDLTNNATDAEFTRYRQSTAASTLPVWPAVGNHEYFAGAGTTYQARIDNYRRYVGPEWYSFDYGQRHFIVLENIGSAPFDEQYEWARLDLAAHAAGKRVVVLMHMPMNVPFGAPSTYDRFRDLLQQYDTELVLVGHEHSNDTDAETEWVEGAKHIQTNSSSYTIDNSPRGFRYVQMRGENFTNPFRMYGVDSSLTVTSPAPGTTLAAGAPTGVQVNAYDTADAISKVSYRLDGGAWHQLKSTGTHTWYTDWRQVPAAGAHTVEVESEDATGKKVTRTSEFTVGTAPATAPAAGTDWPQHHGGVEHGGVTPDVVGPQLDLAWSHRTPGSFLTGTPVIVGGVVYAATRDEDGEGDAKVYAVELATGRRLWEFATDTSVHGSPAVADGTVYVQSLRSVLYAIDARTGTVRWTRQPEAGPAPNQQRSYGYYGVTAAEGKVFWTHQDRFGIGSRGVVSALDPATGATIWDSQLVSSTMADGTPAVSGGRVYVGNGAADQVLALDVNTGQRVWTSTSSGLGGWQDGIPAVGEGVVVMGAGNGAVARDAVTGTNLWVHRSTGPSFIPQNATPSTAAIVDGTVYIGFPDGRVTALDRATGAVRWSRLLEGKPYLGGVASSPVVSGDTLFVGSNNGKLYSLDRATGADRFTYDVGTWVSAGPAVSGNAVVAGAWDGNLYTFTGRAG